MLSIYIKPRLKSHSVCILTLCLCLTGCSSVSQKTSKETTPQLSSQANVVPKPQIHQVPYSETTTNISGSSSRSDVGTCQNEMLALAKVNPRLYAQKKMAFDELLSSAAIYTKVRNKIGDQTRDTMDALYRYKTQKLCSDIGQALLQSLVNRGESIK